MKYSVQNPILRGFHPDPCMIYVDGTYYIATSTFEYFPGVKISASDDLANWRTVAYPLNNLALLDMRGDVASTGIWAPALSYADGKFWLIFTNQRQWLDGHLKDTENYLTTCETIDGEWSAPIKLNGSGFDPSLFHDDNGRKYLVNMRWDYRYDDDSTRFCGILLQEYDHAEGKLIGKPKVIFKGTERKITEGPHIFKKDGYYYLLTAEGGTGYPHCATLARSKSVDGPYELHPNKHLITAWETDCYLQKAGHASLCEGKNGEWMMAHLCGRPLPDGRCMLGRETSLQNVEWHEDGWPYLCNGTMNPSDTFEAFAPAEPRLTEKVYEWDGHPLDIDWMTLRQPFGEDVFDQTSRPGWLRIRGQKSLLALQDQSVLVRRQEAFVMECETMLEFYPEGFNHWAGMTYRYSENNQHYVYISYDEENACRELLKITYDDSRFRLERIAKLPDTGAVWIRLCVDHADGRFYYSLDGEHFEPAGDSFDASKLSDEYNRPLGFTGPYVGMGCQDFSDWQRTADFKYFRYTEIE